MKLPDGVIFTYKPKRKGTAVELKERELIMCRNCKHYPFNSIETYVHCEYMGAEDYCSLAEKMNDRTDVERSI